MAILIDPPAWPAHGTLWSHLVSDSDYDELHAFAALLGVPRRGFDLDHYDVPASLHAQAIERGAIPVSARDIVFRLRDSGLRVRQVERESLAPIRRRQYLIGEWAQLGDALGLGSSAMNRRASNDWLDLGDNLIARWNESHRRYHDERHLEDVLLALNHLSIRGERIRPETLLAAWFHDAVYSGSGGADERDSASLAVRSLELLPLDGGLPRLVGDFIIDTTPARAVEDPPTPLAHLLDADLSMFGASPGRYKQYTSTVRLEYAHVADKEFAAGRSQILRSYLEQPAIYRTTAAQQLWEDRARANLMLEIERLGRA